MKRSKSCTQSTKTAICQLSTATAKPTSVHIPALSPRLCWVHASHSRLHKLGRGWESAARVAAPALDRARDELAGSQTTQQQPTTNHRNECSATGVLLMNHSAKACSFCMMYHTEVQFVRRLCLLRANNVIN